MSESKIVTFFKTKIEPGLQGFDSATRIKALSFLAGVALAMKTHIPAQHNQELEVQFMSARLNPERDKLIRAMSEAFYFSSEYFNLGLNSTYRTIYDTIHLPLGNISKTGIYRLGIDFCPAIDDEALKTTIVTIDRIIRGVMDVIGLVSFWRTRILQPPFLDLTVQTRSTALAEHLGVGLAYAFDLPSTEVTSLSTYYDMTHRISAGDIISAVNESVPVDIDRALLVTKTIWLNRATAAYGPAHVEYLLAQVTTPFNQYLPTKVLEETWLAKLVEFGPLLDQMLTELRSIQPAPESTP